MDHVQFGNLPAPKYYESSISFRSGQIFFGKVIHLDGNGFAKVQFGNQLITAKVDAPLDVSKDYWFRVKRQNEGIRLMISHEKEGDFFGVSTSKEAKLFLSALKDWKVPIDQSKFTIGEKWLKETGDAKRTLEAIRLMIEGKLPFTDHMFKTIFATIKREPFSVLFDRLMKELSNSSVEKKEEISHHLQTLSGRKIHGETPLVETNWGKGHDVYRAIRFLLKEIGIDSRMSTPSEENVVPPSLKDLLSQQLQKGEHLPKQVLKAFEALYYRILGGQLSNKDQNPYMILTFSIPVPLKEKMIDATFQWEGKRGKDGELDKHFSRILFDLNMPRLGKTFIHMNVQNRIISLQVKTEQIINKTSIQSYVQMLKENIEKIGYSLSTIKFERLEQNQSRREVPLSYFHSGKVDVKI
ncbi:hypothetical protein [Fervidibacillus halotolerans]|uniref:Flagellar hook-length control protein FliK n=1 Tax=Fervidibacillus halotolerans TaxID=2980027 RepID=A0A9E8M1E3_9BACI|nr:hypothetical protein [Fervidibacillus halotolerans]WAA13617.1 flagellar hook-length control protein FliK [Fervidibacillus halotolerans]